jgi:hypothetical protein
VINPSLVCFPARWPAFAIPFVRRILGRLVHVAVVLLQRLLAVHHSRAGSLAQRLYILCCEHFSIPLFLKNSRVICAVAVVGQSDYRSIGISVHRYIALTRTPPATLPAAGSYPQAG